MLVKDTWKGGDALSEIMYTLRFPFQIQPGYKIDVDGKVAFESGGREVTLQHRDQFYVLTVLGFASEEEAAKYLTIIRSGLIWLQLNLSVSISASYQLQKVVYSNDPQDPDRSVALDGAFPAVYDSEWRCISCTAGSVSVLQTAPSSTVVGYLLEGMSAAFKDEAVQTAVDLYAAYHVEKTERARLVTLATALEVLARPRERSKFVQETIDSIIELISARQKELGDSSVGEVFELKALEKEIKFRRRQSIRSSIRNRVLEILDGEADAEDVAKQALGVYDSRSALVHTGVLSSTELAKATGSARQIVQRLLISTFKQAAG